MNFLVMPKFDAVFRMYGGCGTRCGSQCYGDCTNFGFHWQKVQECRRCIFQCNRWVYLMKELHCYARIVVVVNVFHIVQDFRGLFNKDVLGILKGGDYGVFVFSYSV